jgi:hypothetical protein
VKAAAHSHGGGILGFAQNVLSAATGGSKFSKEDVKRVYFVSVASYTRTAHRVLRLIGGIGKLAPRLLTGERDDVIRCRCVRDDPMLHYQAVDIAGLSKLTAETITLVVGILGFLVSPLRTPSP